MSAGRTIASVAEFDAAVAEAPAVLAEFVGPDCVVCRNIAPMLSIIEREFAPRLALVSADVAGIEALAERFSVRSLPTLVLFVGGRETARRSGFATAAELRGWLAAALQEPVTP